MQRELKRQIKEDEFATGLARAASWLAAHRREARVTALVVAIVAAGGAALAYFQAKRTRESRQALSEALELFEAPVAAELPEGAERPAGVTVMPTAAEKYRKAAAAFDGVERRFPETEPALRAKYYAALSRIELGDPALYEAARQALTEVASRRELALESGMARLALAELLRRQGEVDKAAEAYRQLLEDASLVLPRDHVLMRLAELLDDAHRAAEARAAYQRLAEEFPGSVYASEARERAAYLETGA